MAKVQQKPLGEAYIATRARALRLKSAHSDERTNGLVKRFGCGRCADVRKSQTGFSQMIVDGYNVIHAWNLDTKNLENARHTLLHILDDYAGFSGEDITVVFDAYNTKSNESNEKQGLLTVVYTEHGVTADTYIQRTAKQSKKRLKVVTADYLEQMSVFEAGAVRITPTELKLYINAAREKHVDLLHRSSLTNAELKTRLKLDAILNQD